MEDRDELNSAWKDEILHGQIDGGWLKVEGLFNVADDAHKSSDRTYQPPKLAYHAPNLHATAPSHGMPKGPWGPSDKPSQEAINASKLSSRHSGSKSDPPS